MQIKLKSKQILFPQLNIRLFQRPKYVETTIPCKRNTFDLKAAWVASFGALRQLPKSVTRVSVSHKGSVISHTTSVSR